MRVAGWGLLLTMWVGAPILGHAGERGSRPARTATTKATRQIHAEHRKAWTSVAEWVAKKGTQDESTILTRILVGTQWQPKFQLATGTGSHNQIEVANGDDALTLKQVPQALITRLARLTAKAGG